MIILTSEVVEAVRGQKHHISAHTLATQCSVHPTAPVLLTKDSIRNEISYEFQPPSRILEPSLQGLISSVEILQRMLDSVADLSSKLLYTDWAPAHTGETQ